MNTSDNKVILHTVQLIAEDIVALRSEVRDGFSSLDKRLAVLEENVEATSKTFDAILEGDVLGKKHITLTRPEYDTMVGALHIPNRFAKA